MGSSNGHQPIQSTDGIGVPLSGLGPASIIPSVKHPGQRPAGDEQVSYIEPHERHLAEEYVRNTMAALTGTTYLPRMAGAFIAVKIYIRPEELKTGTREDGSEYTIYTPASVQQSDQYQSVTGLVVAMGPDCYKSDNHRKFRSRWCEVGDFVMIPRYETFQFMYRGVAMHAVYDDKIVAVIPDPTWVVNGHNQARV